MVLILRIVIFGAKTRILLWNQSDFVYGNLPLVDENNVIRSKAHSKCHSLANNVQW